MCEDNIKIKKSKNLPKFFSDNKKNFLLMSTMNWLIQSCV